MLLETAPSALGVEVVLVPEHALPLGQRWLVRSRDVLDVVAVDGHEPPYPLGEQGRSDARGSAAPVVTRQHGGLDAEHVHEVDEILPECGLLPRAWGGRVAEGRRPEAAE